MSASPDARSFAPAPALGDVDRAILRTVAYASLFAAPLTLDELHRALMDVPLGRDELRRRMEGPGLRAFVDVEEGLVFPRGRREWVASRAARQAHSRALVDRHRAFLERLARFPFVRLVALSGGCAHDNATDDDVDVFLIVERGRAWAVCLALMVVTKWAGLRRSLCLNYIVDEHALALPERDLFTAAEIVGLKALAGAAAYRRFVEANRWAARLFPNFFDHVAALASGLPPAGAPRLERVLRLGPALLLEWAARAALGPYLGRKARGSPGVALERHRLKLHLRDHRPELNAAFATAVEALECGAMPRGPERSTRSGPATGIPA